MSDLGREYRKALEECFRAMDRRITELEAQLARSRDAARTSAYQLKAEFRARELETENYGLREALSSAEKRLGDHWHWQGDGTDDIQSLSCPVSIQPDKLQAIIERAEKAEDRARTLEAENDTMRQALDNERREPR